MELEYLLDEADELLEELENLENKMSRTSSRSLLNNFLNKLTATSESAEKVLPNMVCDYNDTKKNPTDTNVNSINIVDNINDNTNEKKIPYEESIINEVQ